MSNSLAYTEPKLSREEAEYFITNILEIDPPSSSPPTISWINKLVQAFQRKLPFQNITLLSQESCYVPKWEDIYQDVIKDGKGGLCLSLNVALSATLVALGVTAYNAAADYIPHKAKGVHVVTIIDISKATETKLKFMKTQNEIITRSKSSQQLGTRDTKENVYMRNSSDFGGCNGKKIEYIETLRKDSIYLADVGCGYPTLQLIHLKEDLKRVFVNCGLEYCIIKKGRQYVRMHRRGHEYADGEEAFVNNEGWLPVFSFTLVPRDISFFQQSMRSIYVNECISPYFDELHCIIYLNTEDMIVIKNKKLIKYLGTKPNTLSNNVGMENSSKDNVTPLPYGNRNLLSKKDIITLLLKYFPLIPASEIERAVLRYFRA